jgi:hypothetical protein
MSSALQTLPGFLSIINVVILLSALFFFTGTLASHLLEAFVGMINSRGNQLHSRLEATLDPGTAAAIYNDPLIKSLGTVSQWIAGRVHPPSYIEPQFFARVVSKLFATNATVQADSVIKDLAAPTPPEFEAKIIEWFKSINDRQNGVYTRWSFLRLGIIGLAFAVAMDLDTVQIAGAIWANPEASNAMVARLAEGLQPAASGDLTKLTPEQTKKLQDSIAAAVGQLQTTAGQLQVSYAWQKVPAGPKEWLSKLLGWLLTALATSLGAQFWFNILSEAMKLRASGPKPETKEAKK